MKSVNKGGAGLDAVVPDSGMVPVPGEEAARDGGSPLPDGELRSGAGGCRCGS